MWIWKGQINCWKKSYLRSLLHSHQDGLPAGFERLPSAMRPPVAAVVAARAKRHCRSASTGGSFAFSGYGRAHLVAHTTATLPAPLDEKEERESNQLFATTECPMPPSVLKKSSLPNTISGHRRVFSHGQIRYCSPFTFFIFIWLNLLTTNFRMNEWFW